MTTTDCMPVAETEKGKHRTWKGQTACEIRVGFLEEVPLELGLEGRVGVRQVKKGGKGVPGTGNLAHPLPPPHANKNREQQDELRLRLRGPIGLLVIAPTSTKVPAAAGLQTVLPQVREGFKR